MCGVGPFVAAARWLHACPGKLSPQPELVSLCFRRYTSPDEQAFYPNEVPPLVLPPIQYAQVGHFDFVSLPLHRVAAPLRRCYMEQAACFPQVPAPPAASADSSSKGAFSLCRCWLPAPKPSM